MPARQTENLRLTNDRVRGLLNRLQRAEDTGALVKRQDFDSLLGEVTQAAAWLRQLSPQSANDVELAREISDYRNSLEHLQRRLPAIRSRLLAEKVRLEGTRCHLKAALAWADASQGTL
jgi:hypothetical protein